MSAHHSQVCDLAITDIRKLFLSHQRELHIYLTRLLRDADTAMDLTQETFVRISEYKGQGKAHDVVHARSYLYRVAHNLAIDYVRAQKRNPISGTDDRNLESIPNNAPSPEQIVGEQSELDYVKRALGELPEKTRNIFILVRVDGLTYRQTAEKLNISDSSVQKHVARAIAHVMRRMRDNQS
ncbi:MAG: RNA polymerase sigma factor [Thalassospira sp.]|uniref:RNA polymerase sigma factor n=1 Tax=Thalassospira sp. TaxID=1912094 RepID=UPI0032F021AA